MFSFPRLLQLAIFHAMKRNMHVLLNKWEARWPSGRVSDSGARGQSGLDTYLRRVMSLSKMHLLPEKYW